MSNDDDRWEAMERAEMAEDRARELLAAKDAEIDRLRSADELLRVGIRQLELDSIVKDAEIAALRERCGRLAECVEAWREYDQTFSKLVGVTAINLMLGNADFYRLCDHLGEAMQQVKDHNDLQPPAGKESTDG